MDSILTGFVMKSHIPACKHLDLSAAKALAVRATMCIGDGCR